MAGNNLFRTVMFGGYNRQDVNEYIQSLEYEVEAGKKARQEEKLRREREEKEREQEEVEIPLLRQEIERLNRELEIARAENENGGSGAEAETGSEDAEENGEAFTEYVRKIQTLEEELEETLKENEKLRAERQRTGRSGKGEEGDNIFSYDTVKRIMEDAHRNADLITKEAKQKADRIVKEAEEEAEKQKELIVERINAQLDEKGIQLIAAKYKIEQYMKDVSNASQALYNIYTHMSGVLETMPTRIDNYWEGDYQKLVEKSRGEIEGAGNRQNLIKKKTEET